MTDATPQMGQRGSTAAAEGESESDEAWRWSGAVAGGMLEVGRPHEGATELEVALAVRRLSEDKEPLVLQMPGEKAAVAVGRLPEGKAAGDEACGRT
ncbi:MAG TPA: hypothetical protein VFQ41_05820 [Candidatus Angelobacter sp.]|nr:hypothetical protein [Candidatus Angelobacter sp.]